MKARLVAIAIVLATIASPAAAQGRAARVSGTVKDLGGRTVSGAAVSLISESRGLVLARTTTNATGDFILPDIAPDAYTVVVEMPSFSPLRRTGLWVGAGARLGLGTLTIGLGTRTETVVVAGGTPAIQAVSGEKSYAIPRDWLANLPLAGRRYVPILGLIPGVVVTPGDAAVASRLGGGETSVMFDGAIAVEPPGNRAATTVGVETIQDLSVTVSSYQAEYGRSSGLQINAVTKSGTNRFAGTAYDVERHSRWNANSRTNMLNGDPKPVLAERDAGFSIGGPVGRPGGSNRLFFFIAQEFQPRRAGGDVVRYRFPTLLERQGDFSATTDQLGQPYRLIKDPTLAGNCTANNFANPNGPCFPNARIPASRQYAPGMAILNWYPLPNLDNVPAGQAYNFESRTPVTSFLGHQSVIRVDYQPRPTLRGSFRSSTYEQPRSTSPGTLPGWNDTRADNFGLWTPSATVNWSVTPVMFVDVVWGASTHHQEGCPPPPAGVTACRSGLQINSIANRVTAGFGELPYLFPDATRLDTGSLAYDLLARSGGAIWDGTRVQAAPSFTWGGRVANSPPNNIGPFGDGLTDGRAMSLNVGVTRVMGRHTARAGYAFFRSDRRRGQGAFLGQISFQNDTTNPLDTTFPFANAAIGVFNSYRQQSRWSEGTFVAVNHEAWLQDTWKARSNLTIDYGLRFVHQVPEHDASLGASNFLPDRWEAAQAPALYIAGCANGAATCVGQRRAMDPRTGQFLVANTGFAVGTLVPSSGNATNGLAVPGRDIVDTGWRYPALAVGPRASLAWQVVGNPQLVLRGGGGLYFDRPPMPGLYDAVNNPPSTRIVTLRFGQLQNLGSSLVTTEAAPAVTAVQYDMPLPASAQWSAGAQVAVPFHAVVDISYAGQKSYNMPMAVDLNSIDPGTAFLPQYADLTQATRTPANSYVGIAPDIARFYRGYSSIVQQQAIGGRTYHALQVSLTRRLLDGFSFGISDTIQISDRQRVAPRLQHNADGTVTTRADQSIAQELLGNNQPPPQIVRAAFTWDLPDVRRSSFLGRSLGLVVNDWRLAGVWQGQSGTAYSVGYSYQNGGSNVSLTGSPDYAGRVVLIAAPGAGCSSNPLQQFDWTAYEGPVAGSVGLDSPSGYLRGCFQSSMDLSLARTFPLAGRRALEVRADVFNALNQAAVTDRNSVMQLPNPAFPGAILNLPYGGADGSLIAARAVPRGAGFGVASDYQPPRAMQLQVRFLF